MSKETLAWLNTNTLVGFTEKRGQAWHWMAGEQGEQSNHYPGAIPTEDVLSRLFNFEVIKVPIRYTLPEQMDLINGVAPAREMEDTTRVLVVNSKTGDPLGVFKSDYETHQFQDSLIGNLQNVIGNDVQVGSAGLLRNRAVAWVSLETDNIETKQGVTFRPHLLAYGSHDGTLATGYKFVNTLVVCDNTLTMALGERGQAFKVKHTKNSQPRLKSAADALGIISKGADAFALEIQRLCETTVTDKMWSEFVQAHVPSKESKRGQTMAENKRGALTRLWSSDSRVEPWKNTAFGVLQAVNTWHTHEMTVRGEDSSRQERKWDNVLSDQLAKLDMAAMMDLNKVLASA